MTQNPEVLPSRPLRLRGRAWMFGDEVNTDDMYPGFAMKLPTSEAVEYMFNATRPEWPKLVSPGDMVVGGRRFGLGSSRPVPQLFRALGVSCVLAEEFNSLFLRNCINYGLPVLTVPDIRQHVAEGNEIVVDVRNATVTDTASGEQLHGESFPDFILDIIEQGGVLSKLSNEGYLVAEGTTAD